MYSPPCSKPAVYPSHPIYRANRYIPVFSGEKDPDKPVALMEATGWKMIRSADYRYIAHDDGTGISL